MGLIFVVALVIGGIFLLFLTFRIMNFSKVVAIMKKHSVVTFGERGSGKDVLFSNVVVARKKPYCSNLNYCEFSNKERKPFHYPFEPIYIKLGGNKFKNFADNNIIPYSYPLPDGVDYYISDAGVYFPSTEDSDLNKDYPEVPMFQALLRQIGDAEFHCNLQNIERLWKKIREQSTRYILCLDCEVSKRGWVKQKIRIYDRYESAVNKVEPLDLPMPMLGKQVKIDVKTAKANYRAKYGRIYELKLFYKNKSSFDSRRFKRMLEQGTQKVEKEVKVIKVK